MSLAAGVPASWPVVALKEAHAGLPTIENVSPAPRGLDATGVNAYVWPEFTDTAGVPKIVGGAVDDETIFTPAAADAFESSTATAVTVTVD